MDDPFEKNAIVLSDPERAAWDAYVHELAGLLGLARWQISITRHAPSDENQIAIAHIRAQGEVATIALSAYFTRQAAPEQRQTIVHELLHCHIQHYRSLVDALLEGELGRRSEQLAGAALTQHEEIMIDRLAYAIAYLFPLPTAVDWPSPGL